MPWSKVATRRFGGVGVLAGLLLCLAATSSQAFTRRALLVAIDKYRTAADVKPSGSQEQVVASRPARRKDPAGRGVWTDLDGAVNDALALRELLVARFAFRPSDIVTLTNAQATRDAIVSSFRRHLINEAESEDVALFFYAGHGSQVRNSLTDEPDGMDETVVPADSRAGAPDLRDKELNRLFNAALDKRVRLTVIVDSCHSGSIARGLPRVEKTRNLPPDDRDIAEAPDGTPAAEERGALVLSAAQDNQLAGEISDGDGNHHGVFSLAMLRTLQTASPRESAQTVFLKIKALMQSEGRLQEPVLAGAVPRPQQPLFGDEAALSDRTRVAVLRKEKGARITLQGGLAVGLRVGCELSLSGAPTEPRPRLRVVETRGLAAAEAEVIAGRGDDIQAGDIFEVDRWVVEDAPLRVYWGPMPTGRDLRKAIERLATLRNSAQVDWVEDPTSVSPTHTLSWDGKAWRLRGPDVVQSLGALPSAADVLRRMKASPVKPRLFVRVPADQRVLGRLRLGEGTSNDSVAVTGRPEDAQYLLVGRMEAAAVEYSWVVPNLSEAEAARNAFAMPVRTDWTREPAELEEQALRLHRLRSWLRLEPPKEPGLFPYRLALRNAETTQIHEEGPLRDGEGYGLILRAKPGEVERGVEQRYVYVFAIDSYGNSTLLFPRVSAGNVENRVPYPSTGSAGFPVEIPLGRPRLFTVGPPFGVDTYVLLTTAQPIADPTVLEFRGVRARGATNGNPLARLVANVGAPSRGIAAEAPSDWSIERLTIRSVSGKD